MAAQIVLLPAPELVPRALHRAEDALDDLGQALAAAQTVADVFPLWLELARMTKAALALQDMAANKAEQLMKES